MIRLAVRATINRTAFAAVLASAAPCVPAWGEGTSSVDSPGYARRATWQETLYATREALIARDAAWIASGQGEAGLVPGVTFGPWYRIGPFAAPAGSIAVDHPLPPERESDASKPIGDLTWQEDRELKDSLTMQGRSEARHAGGDRVMYFRRTIAAAEPTRIVATFRWNPDGGWNGMAAWMGDKKVFRQDHHVYFTGHDLNVRLSLRKGDNRLLLKVVSRGRDFSFGFRCLGAAELLAGIAGNVGAESADPRIVGPPKPSNGWHNNLGPNAAIDWKHVPRPPFEHALNPLWNRLAANFPGQAERRQMTWERMDGIWDVSWPKGSTRSLALRYAERCDGALQAEARRLAEAARTAADLDTVRRVYYSSKRIAQAPSDAVHEAFRLAVEDLARTFGARYPKGREYLDRIESLRRALATSLPGARAGDAEARAAFDRAFEQYDDLRSEALLANPLLDFERLLLVRRFAGYCVAHVDNGNDPGQPTNFQQNCSIPSHGWDNEIAVLSPVRPDGRLTPLYRPADMAYVGDVDLHWNADRMLFSSLNDRGRWQVFEIGVDGKGLRQVNRDEQPDVDNYDACYLPDGRIVFCSTATFQGVICTAGSDHVAHLHIMNADGIGVRRLCFDQEHNWHPAVLNDGRVLFTRWEYADFTHVQGRLPMTMNPDGTNQRSTYKSNSWFPVALLFGTPVPGHPYLIAAIASGHHGSRRKGFLTLINPSVSQYEAEGIVQMIPPGRGQEVKPGIHDGFASEMYPAFLHPRPLSEKYILVSGRPTWERPFGIYLVDVFNNIVLVREDAEYGLYEPIPLVKRPCPPVIPDRVNPARKDADVYVADVYRGPGLAGVPRGAVKALRLYALNYGYRNCVNFKKDLGPFDVRRILGTVPVQPDGSALFRVPANTPISFQPLDADGQALQLMRSWYTAMPGEKVSCVGCHERARDLAPPQRPMAFDAPPAEIQPWRGPARGVSFDRDVKPALARHCSGCHRPDRKDLPNVLDYRTLRGFIHIPPNESGVPLFIPGQYLADSSPLIRLIKKGHHGVKPDAELLDRIVTWHDLGAPSFASWKDRGNARIPDNMYERKLDMRRRYAQVDDDYDALPATAQDPVEPIVPAKEPATAAPVACPGWPFDAAEAARRQQAASAVTRRQVILRKPGDGKPVMLDLVLIPAGEFVMGDPAGAGDERPAARVRIETPFWISRCEISNEQFGAFASGDARAPLGPASYPVVNVSWDQAMAFCRRVSEATGEQCLLPTEAQWEYACRAGTATAPVLAAKAAGKQPALTPCGAGTPNAWGLCDMQGNVAEWTRSLYQPYPFVEGDGRNDSAVDGMRVIRGGSFLDRPKDAAASFRWRHPHWLRQSHVGFRVVMAAKGREN
jgi:formylglycine-generating enzyme required for sulfatase activity